MTSLNQISSCEMEDTGERSLRGEPLFPLPLSPFEQYMFQDDRADYPMTFVIAAELSGHLQRQDFEISLRGALERHPLINAKVETRFGATPRWIPQPAPSAGAGPTCEFDWADDDRPLKCDREQIDITRQTGLRVWVRKRAPGWCVTFQFHHSCCDGLGAVQFIGDILALYGQRTTAKGEEAPELEALIPERLRLRATFAPSDSQDRKPLLRRLLSPKSMFGRLMKLLGQRPIPLQPGAKRPRPGSKEFLPFPATVSRILCRQDVQQVKLVAVRTGATPNDLYLAGMLRTIARWNETAAARRSPQSATGGEGTASSEPREDAYLRIGIPNSLRAPHHDQMPAANVVSYTFLTRRVSECRSPLELIQSIQRQTSRMLHSQQGKFIVVGMKHVLKIPGLLKLLLKFNRCFSTVILANVGDVKRQFTARFPLKQGRCVAGNVVLQSLQGAAPVRPQTSMSMSLGTYAGNLYINLHCDPLSYTRLEAEQFIEMFVDEMEQLCRLESEPVRVAA